MNFLSQPKLVYELLTFLLIYITSDTNRLFFLLQCCLLRRIVAVQVLLEKVLIICRAFRSILRKFQICGPIGRLVYVRHVNILFIEID